MNINRYDLYLGCKDKDSFNDTFTVEKIKNNLVNICGDKKIGFHMSDLLGGYLHDSGKYVLEKSLKITFMGEIDEDIITKIANILKKEYNQESIMAMKKVIQVKGSGNNA